VTLETDDEEERLVRIEQMMESLKAQTTELAGLTKRAAVRTVRVREASQTLREQTQRTRNQKGAARKR
jgi:hypothetical protein